MCRKAGCKVLHTRPFSYLAAIIHPVARYPMQEVEARAHSVSSTHRPSFLLTKWYLDCVAENGDVAIVYVARLDWNKLTIRYGSLLTAMGGLVRCASSLGRCAFPQLDGDVSTLHLPHLGIEGQWRTLRASQRRKVFSDPTGSIVWHCHQPMSRVELCLQKKNRMTGLGYVECLTLSILPWKLPLKELHWGRFLSEKNSLVWIDWRGPREWRSLIHNGEEQRVDRLTDGEIHFSDEGARLSLDRGLVLRSGRLGETVLAGISKFAGLLPHRMLSVEECKWRSCASLQTGAIADSGWAIHEVVRWKR